MKNIFENPYCIIGVVANASEKDLQQRKSKIQAFARIGKVIDSEFDFSFLPAIERSSEQIERAFASIEQAQDKVNHALFWFINATPIDAVALEHLKNGDTEKASKIWIKIIADAHETITAKNFSAFANLSTLTCAKNRNYPFALVLKAKLVESEAFTDFVHLVADQTVTVDTQKQLEWLIEQFFIDLKTYEEWLYYILYGSSTQVQQLVAKRFTQEPIHLIETELAKAEKGRKDAPRNAYQIGKNLFATTKAALSKLQKILGNNDLNYKRLSDSVAKTLIQCSIDYVNALQETADPFDQGLELLKWAETLAVNSLTKERIAENKKTLEEIADRARNREITDAIVFLQMVKNMYEENERDIRQKIKEFERTLPSPYGQTITIKWDWERVNDNIRNSINWDRVIETITKDEIPRENITKIKAHTDTNRIKQYKDLVTFLFSKLNYSQKSQVSYLKYWETSSSTSSNTRTASTSSTTTKTTSVSSSTSTQSTSSSSYSSSSPSKSGTSNSTNNSQSNVSRSSTNTSNNNKSNIYSLSDGCLATILLVIFLVVMMLILIAKLGNSK